MCKEGNDLEIQAATLNKCMKLFRLLMEPATLLIIDQINEHEGCTFENLADNNRISRQYLAKTIEVLKEYKIIFTLSNDGSEKFLINNDKLNQVFSICDQITGR